MEVTAYDFDHREVHFPSKDQVAQSRIVSFEVVLLPLRGIYSSDRSLIPSWANL